MFVTLQAFREKSLKPELIRRIFELRILKLQGEYTTEPGMAGDEAASGNNEDTASAAKTGEAVRTLWRYALTAPLTRLYSAEQIGVLPQGSADLFGKNVDRLFRRQNAHNFRSLKVLEQI